MGLRVHLSDEHWVIYGSVQSLFCTSETDVTVYINYTKLFLEVFPCCQFNDLSSYTIWTQ